MQTQKHSETDNYFTLLLSCLNCTCVLRILKSADDRFCPSSCSMVCWIPEQKYTFSQLQSYKEFDESHLEEVREVRMKI